jgi:hypothetical protein
VTKEQLEAIRKRAEAATAAKISEWYVDDEYSNVVVRDAWDCELIAQGIPKLEDAEFIAHARKDVPALLAEIDRLRGNLRTIEVLTTCGDTKDFAKRALANEATIVLGGA